MIETTLIAVFITGLFGGLHCAGMCGGIVSALACRQPVKAIRVIPRITNILRLQNTGHLPAATSALPTACEGIRCSNNFENQFTTQLLYNSGRLATYTTLGAVAGAVGSVGWWMGVAMPFQQVAFFFTNVLLIGMGLYLGGVKIIGNAAESLGRGLWRSVSPVAASYLKRPGPLNTVAAGILWGLVPCGMVYGVLIAALFSGSAIEGAALMLAFGLGTLPSLLLLGTSGSWFIRKSRQPGLRKAVGAIIVLYGVFGILRLDAAEHLPVIGQLCSQLPGITAGSLL